MKKLSEELKKFYKRSDLRYLVFLKPLNSRFFVVTGGSIFCQGINTIINSSIFYGNGFWFKGEMKEDCDSKLSQEEVWIPWTEIDHVEKLFY